MSVALTQNPEVPGASFPARTLGQFRVPTVQISRVFSSRVLPKEVSTGSRGRFSTRQKISSSGALKRLPGD